MDVSINPNILHQLITTEARALHEITHSLSSCGVGKIVNLPQIIVLGEQSAGKSSVLKAISHVCFPVNGDLCTRFAMELVLRRARATRVDVSLGFADKSRPTRVFQRTGFSQDDLPGFVREAEEFMGISTSGPGFSNDVLRLEIEGPDMYPLTLVDLPGLCHADTAHQPMRDEETVDQLVDGYMKLKNSTVLLLASHVALRKVKEYDPQGERTLGVITKPDLTRPGCVDERSYIQLLENQGIANVRKLGWHVLRNRAGDEATLDSRDINEKRFFQATAWGAIPREHRGVVSLRKKLGRISFDHVRDNMHGVVADSERKLRERREELDRLGKPRSRHEDMRSYLLSIAGDFQRLARDGIHGRYSDAFFGDPDDEDRKLRAQLRNFHRVFGHALSTRGCRQVIVENEIEDDMFGISSTYPNSTFLKLIMVRYPYDFPDPQITNTQDFNAQIQRQAASNQGCEFPGFPNKDLVMQLFRKQASAGSQSPSFTSTKSLSPPKPSSTSCSDTSSDHRKAVQQPRPSCVPVSLRTFAENVINLAVESCLICDIPDISTPTKVDRMSKETLSELAAEPEDAQSRREHLQREIEMLCQGLEQCQRYKPRTVTVCDAVLSSASAHPSQPPSEAAAGLMMSPSCPNALNSRVETSRVETTGEIGRPEVVRKPVAASPSPGGIAGPSSAAIQRDESSHLPIFRFDSMPKDSTTRPFGQSEGPAISSLPCFCPDSHGWSSTASVPESSRVLGGLETSPTNPGVSGKPDSNPFGETSDAGSPRFGVVAGKSELSGEISPTAYL
ncbi:Interferon-induced GTP-binding protein Mx3, partial [Tolypocladium capitatum]